MGQTSGENLSESVNFARVDQSWKTRKHDAGPCGRGRIERGDELLAGCVLLLNRCGENQKEVEPRKHDADMAMPFGNIPNLVINPASSDRVTSSQLAANTSTFYHPRRVNTVEQGSDFISHVCYPE